MRFGLLAVVGLAGVSLASPAFAVTFPAPSFFGQANTTFQQWEGFSSATAPNAATAVTNTAGTPTYRDSSAPASGGFLIGTPPLARIYSFSGVITPEITVPTPTLADGVTDIVLQTQTFGTLLDAASFYALADAGTPVLATDVELVVTGSGSGAVNTYTVTWDDLPSATGYTLSYAAAGSSSSQVGARVDTFTSVSVPEPTALAGLALIGAGLLRRRSR